MEHIPTNLNPSTTFVKVNTVTFKEVVQRVTGPSETDMTREPPPAKPNIGVKKPAFKLHERREYKAEKLEIIRPSLNLKQTFCPSSGSVNGDRVHGSSSSLSMAELNAEEEEKAISEKRFYVHPSPRSKPGFAEPELLSLFPLTSPRTSG